MTTDNPPQGQNFLSPLQDLLSDRAVARFIYFSVIVLTGYMVLTFISDDNFYLGRGVFVGLLWFLLIILLDPPSAINEDIDPFDNPYFRELDTTSADNSVE